MAEAVSVERRQQAVVKALADNATIQSLTTSPWVLAGAVPDVGASPAPLNLVTVRREGGVPDATWRGAVTERYAVDVWVDEEAASDALSLAGQIAGAVDAALTPAALASALAAVGATNRTAMARLVARWAEIPEEAPSHTVHLSATYEVAFVATT
jgi:hypothetical protein